MSSTGELNHCLNRFGSIIYFIFLHYFRDTPWSIALEHKFIPEYLQKDYATAMHGKWHLGMHRNASTPWNRGFEEHSGYLQGCESDGTHIAACCHASDNPGHDDSFVCKAPSSGKDYRGFDWFSNGAPDFSARGTRSAQLIRQSALKFLEKHASDDDDEPFFLYLPFQNIHAPYDVHDEYAHRFANNSKLTQNERFMFGYISEMDDVVGVVVETLKEKSLWDDTLIIFSSDNGAPPAPNVRGRNYPLRGFKSQVYEGGVKVPGFVSGGWLPDAARGSKWRGLAHITDWLPTILKITQSGSPAGEIDGHDIFQSLVENSPSPRTELIYNVNPLCESGQAGAPKAGIQMIIEDVSWKLLAYCYSVKGIAGAKETGPTVPPGGLPKEWRERGWNTTVLFNLSADPGELYDIAWMHPDIVQKLLARLKEVAESGTVEPMQWTAPFQGKNYECAKCPLRPATGPNRAWIPWIK